MWIFVNDTFLKLRSASSGEKENDFAQWNISCVKTTVPREATFHLRPQWGKSRAFWPFYMIGYEESIGCSVRGDDLDLSDPSHAPQVMI